MQKSETINDLAKALCEVQKVLEGAKKDSSNPFYKSKYADLSSVWQACKEPLTKNGLSVAQLPGKDADGYFVETMLMHESGQWICSKTYATPTKDDPQAIGSAITYSRRYGLAAIVGCCPEDDDAEGAMNRQQQARPPQPERPRTYQHR